MKVGGTRVGFCGRWASNAPTEVLRQKPDWVKKKGHFGDKGKQIGEIGQL